VKNCSFHRRPIKTCSWCKKWKKTYKYFRDLGKKDLTFYCVHLEHYRTGEKFSKVGLTSSSVEERFDVDMERFKISKYYEQVLPLYEAVTQETSVLYDLEVAGRLYCPKAKISGYTECFR
jgi:hypothetical protein